MKRFTQIKLIILALFTLTGCGNMYQPNYPSSVSASSRLTYSPSSASGGNSCVTQEGEFICPCEPNIKPVRDIHLDGGGYFKACVHGNLNLPSKIRGQTYYPNTSKICVYPLRPNQDGALAWIADPQSGHPVHQCIEIASTGVFPNFGNLDHVGFAIVDEADNAEMFVNCSTGKSCPPYSIGRFR